MDDGIELASLTAAFEAIRDMLARPFTEDMHKPTPNPGWDVGVLFDHVMDLTVRIGAAAGIIVWDNIEAAPQQRLAAVVGPIVEGWRRRQMQGEIIWRTRRLADPVAINVLPRVLLIVLAFPALSVIVAAGTGWVFLTAISVLTVLHMACTALLNMVVAEAFPPSVRAMAVSTTYAVGLAIFGGSAQFVATSVVAYTGDPRSIAGIFALATAMSLLAFLRMHRQTTVGVRSSSN